MYINTIISSLEPVPSRGVMPVDRPTVPKALVISNRASGKATSGSSTSISQVQPITSVRASRAITADLRNSSPGMDYLKAFSCLLVAEERMPRNSTKKVVVLMPPPVEPGEAPMNISTIMVS